jgi:hypothetical protein
MDQRISSALFAILNEFRSRREKLDSRSLAKRISEQNLSFSASDVAEVGGLIRRFFGDQGPFSVPPLLLPVISALIQDGHDKTICDPWAGIGTILATAQETTDWSDAAALSGTDYQSSFRINPVAARHMNFLQSSTCGYP